MTSNFLCVPSCPLWLKAESRSVAMQVTGPEYWFSLIADTRNSP